MIWGFSIPREDVEQAFALFCATVRKSPEECQLLQLEFAAWMITNSQEITRLATLRRISQARSANTVDNLRTTTA